MAETRSKGYKYYLGKAYTKENIKNKSIGFVKLYEIKKNEKISKITLEKNIRFFISTLNTMSKFDLNSIKDLEKEIEIKHDDINLLLKKYQKIKVKLI